MANLTVASDTLVADLSAVLGEALSLSADVTATLTRDTGLFGNLPELDSCATAGCDQPAPFVLAHARPTCHDHTKDYS